MKITIYVLALIFLASCTQKTLEEGKYRINGTVSGMENGEIYLSNYPETDTVKVVKGKFQIENSLDGKVGQIHLTKYASLSSMVPESMLPLFVEPTIMSLSIDYEDFSKSNLTGSQTQDDQYRLDQIRKEIEKDYQAELEEFKKVGQKYRDASKAGASAEELEAIKYEDNACREKLAPMWAMQQEATLEFIKNNPKSYVSVYYMAFVLSDLSYEEAKAIYDQFNPEHVKIGMAARLEKSIEDMRKGVPGAPAGNFSTTDINGNPLKLDDFKGKYLLIDFWASWCVPCRKGNPHLIEIFEKYNKKGLEILGVSDDDRNPAQWKKAVEKDKVGIWYHVLRGATFDRETMQNKYPEKDISDKYNISSLPTKILVGPDGIILGRFGSGGGSDEDMDKMLAEIFEN